MSPYQERAKQLREITERHYSCAQATLVPFAKEAGISEETAYQVAANFGGGMKMKSVCGAVTGGLMVLGLFGIDDQKTISEYYRKLKENHEGYLNCEDYLRLNQAAGRANKPSCDNIVCECVGLVEDILRENGKLQ